MDILKYVGFLQALGFLTGNVNKGMETIFPEFLSLNLLLMLDCKKTHSTKIIAIFGRDYCIFSLPWAIEVWCKFNWNCLFLPHNQH